MSGATTQETPTSGRESGLPDKRDAIVHAAIVTFLERGYELASVDAIARLAGVSKQTVYNSFGDKRRLFGIAVRQARFSGDAGVEPSTELLRDGRRLVKDLIEIGREFLGVVLAPSVCATRRLIIGEATRHPDLYDACADTATLAGPRVVGWFLERVRVLTASGVLTTDEPERVARQFFGLLLHEGLIATGYGTRRLPDQVAERICGDTAQLIAAAYVAPAGGRNA